MDVTEAPLPLRRSPRTYHLRMILGPGGGISAIARGRLRRDLPFSGHEPHGKTTCARGIDSRTRGHPLARAPEAFRKSPSPYPPPGQPLSVVDPPLFTVDGGMPRGLLGTRRPAIAVLPATDSPRTIPLTRDGSQQRADIRRGPEEAGPKTRDSSSIGPRASRHDRPSPSRSTSPSVHPFR